MMPLRCNSIYPEYSVLMPVYAGDDSAFLSDAIESMLSQTAAPAEMVIVCDGPLTDALDAVISRYQNAYDDLFSVVRLPENKGLGNALREGLRFCNCEVVARMDSDDISRSRRCELLLDKMVAEELDLVGGAIEEFNVRVGDMKSVRRPPLRQEDIERYSKSRNPFNHMTVMFRKDAVIGAGSYLPFHLMEDYYLWVRMIQGGCKCANINDVVVDVRTGSGMYQRRSNVRYLRSQHAFFKELVEVGYVTNIQAIKTLTARFVATVLPSRAVKSLYNIFLRG